jgi:hypothetical protein
MPGKEQIVEELGDLLLPNLVNQGLVANDQVKFLMTLLQTAMDHANHPDGRVANLEKERIACGIKDVGLDAVIGQSRSESDGEYRIPRIQQLHDQIVENLELMLAPIEAADASLDGEMTQFRQRLDRLIATAPPLDDDRIPAKYISEMTSGHPASGDSFHLLVMNMHKTLNRLQRMISSETIDGAQVYGVTDWDRDMISAFMRGVNRTRKLKFDHPGLDTTATRSDEKLVIQNDIGTTDAHVLVIHVTSSQVTLTYSDVHIQRLLFFQNLSKGRGVEWKDTVSRRSTKLDESLYHLSVGTFTAAKDADLVDYLEFLGSRLVFLIDWNRARKQLRKIAPKRVCLDVLRWAADHDLGHMAFLKVGGAQLILNALQLASRVPLQMVGQLPDMIGVKRCTEFLKCTLKTAAEGLLNNKSELLIRDQVRAELRHYLDTAHQGMLELAAEHAALIVELATTARDCLLLPDAGMDPDYLKRQSRHAKKWEHLADEMVTKARATRGAGVESKAAAQILRIADDAADELEEGIFLLTLLDQHSSPGLGPLSGESLDILQRLASQLVFAAQEYLKSVENARIIDRESRREEMADFLAAVDHTISVEHRTDDIQREAKAHMLDFTGDFKQFHVFTEIIDNLETAADHMMRAALTLRDYILDEVITR